MEFKIIIKMNYHRMCINVAGEANMYQVYYKITLNRLSDQLRLHLGNDMFTLIFNKLKAESRCTEKIIESLNKD